MEAAPGYELTLLLILGSRTIIDELHTRLAQLGYDDVRPAHGFAFQRIAPNGATGNEIAEFLDITKQAASEMVDYLEKHGYVQRRPHPTDRRGKLVMLTERGWDFLQASGAILSELGNQWAAVIGQQNMETWLANLRQLILAANGGTWPQKLRPTW